MATSHVIYCDENLTAVTTGAVTGARFVDISANKQGTIIVSGQGTGLDSTASGGNVSVATASAGGTVFGVAANDAASGARVLVLRGARIVAEVTADGAITAGGAVEVGTAGKAKAKGTGATVGRVIADVADGALALVELA